MNNVFREKTQWERKEYFNQQTSFSITRDIDISLFREDIKRQGYNFYPALIYIITRSV
ncbi:CatA-like O-acetyltransferase [Oceanobacillus caeni]|uniref:CatA-like O-acetyltransferase n=1 Tax=Oceanobacillus caeni TaxID=405946 RepID=UPI001957E745